MAIGSILSPPRSEAGTTQPIEWNFTLLLLFFFLEQRSLTKPLGPTFSLKGSSPMAKVFLGSVKAKGNTEKCSEKRSILPLGNVCAKTFFFVLFGGTFFYLLLSWIFFHYFFPAAH